MRKTLMVLLTIFIALFAAAQNVGIGTFTPVFPLDVNGTSNSNEYRSFGRNAIRLSGFNLELYYTNTLVGDSAGHNISTGVYNTFIGSRSGSGNTTGYYNTAVGSQALLANTTGESNTAVGFMSLEDNTTGNGNTAIGRWTLRRNTQGFDNTAVGKISMQFNETGDYNTALGSTSMLFNTTGNYNTGVGSHALYRNASGSFNSAFGSNAFITSITGSANTACGYEALVNSDGGNNNTAIGYRALQINVAGDNNTAIGHGANLAANNQANSIAIGFSAISDASFRARIGNTSMTSIGGQVGWTTFSDARFKQNIKHDVPGLVFITKLQPVTYIVDVAGIENYYAAMTGQKATETAGNPHAATAIQSGFLAQDVEKLATSLGYQFSGIDKPGNDKALYGLRYADFVVPLVKAVQEQQQIIEELKIRVEALEKKTIDKN